MPLLNPGATEYDYYGLWAQRPATGDSRATPGATAFFTDGIGGGQATGAQGLWASASATEWTAIGGVSGAVIPFNSAISFTRDAVMETTVATTPIVFTPIGTGAKEAATTSVTIISGAGGVPDVSAFGVTGPWGSNQGFDNSEPGIQNTYSFFWRGGLPRYSINYSFVNPANSTPVAPSWSAPPVITAATVGSPVVYTSGTAAGTPTPTKAYLRATIDGAPVGVDGTSYVPQAGDVGKALRVYERATNSVGVADSAPSAAFTVVAAAVATTPLTMLRTVYVDEATNTPSAGKYSYTAQATWPSSTFGSAMTTGNKSLPVSADGFFYVTHVATADRSFFIGLKSGASQPARSTYATWDCAIVASGSASLYRFADGPTATLTNTAIVPANGDIVRIGRVAGVLVAQLARAANPGSFTTIVTYTAPSTAQLWPMLDYALFSARASDTATSGAFA